METTGNTLLLQENGISGSYSCHFHLLEFGIFLDPSIIVVPRDYEFVGQTTLGDGKKWKTKYASVGVNCRRQRCVLRHYLGPAGRD